MSRPFGPSASQKRVAPARQLGVALAEKRPDQALKGLRQRRIRDVALVLVELAGREQPARRHQHLVQLVDDRGLADAGISGDQHQLRRAALDDAIEGGEQASSISRSRPYSFSGISSRSGVSCSPSGKSSMRRCASHSARQRRRSRSTPAAVW